MTKRIIDKEKELAKISEALHRIISSEVKAYDANNTPSKFKEAFIEVKEDLEFYIAQNKEFLEHTKQNGLSVSQIEIAVKRILQNIMHAHRLSEACFVVLIHG